MSTMKTGIMVLLAVTFGVLLIGVVPNQISSIRGSTEMKTLTSRAFSGSVDIFNVTNEQPQVNSNGFVINKDEAIISSTGNSTFTLKLDANVPENHKGPLDVVATDLPYYSLWAVNILIALVAFLVARRRM